MEYDLKRFALHPLLFSIYPVLALLAFNISEVDPAVAVRPVLASVALSQVALVFFYLLTRNWRRAALLTTVILILFYSYGHLYQFLEENPVSGVTLGRHRYLIPVYAGTAVLGAGLILWKVKNLSTATLVLNITAAAILIFPIFQIAEFQISLRASEQASQEIAALGTAAETLHAEDPPDIYYIVLDTYTRADALQKDFQFDNSDFIRRMEKMGFFIASCSRTNYGYTQGAITAALNLNYLDTLKEQLASLGSDSENLWVLLKQSWVRRQLESLGYVTVAFETGYEWSRLADADVYLGLQAESFEQQMISPFESMFIKSTAGLILTDSQIRVDRSAAAASTALLDAINFPYGGYVERQTFILEQLKQIPAMPGPKFVFAHLLIPHEPHVFDPGGAIRQDPSFYGGKNGTAINDLYRREGYIGEVQFINDQMLEISETILAQSDPEPVIIIQGDHGVKKDNRLLILNAYYLPGDGDKRLYPTISPVNSFRVVFDAYFGTDHGLLPDISYRDAEAEPETAPGCVP